MTVADTTQPTQKIASSLARIAEPISNPVNGLDHACPVFQFRSQRLDVNVDRPFAGGRVRTTYRFQQVQAGKGPFW